MLELMCLEEATAEADKIITIAMSEQKTSIKNILPGTPSDDHNRQSSITTDGTKPPPPLKSRFSAQIKRRLTKQVFQNLNSKHFIF